ncbi:MAG: hypothetical protein ACREJO_10635 [Phycisphaerales bacterium]
MATSHGPGRITPDSAHPVRAGRRAWSVAMFAFGLCLLVAAVWVVTRQSSALADAWAAARTSPPWMIAAIVLLPLVNWLLSSVIFWIITNRYGRVGFWEMSALLGSAWLLNMLPMKPGLVGRVAYHRAISGIPIATSLMALALAFASGLAGIALAVALTTPPARVGAQMVVGIMVVSAPILWGISKSKGKLSATDLVARCTLAALVRSLDTYIWAIRYALVFKIVGIEGLTPGVVVAIAGVSQIAGQFPVQFGLREWVVGWSASQTGSSTRAAAGLAALAPGLTADLINRACEIACALPVGLVSSAWVFRRLRRAQQPLSTAG